MADTESAEGKSTMEVKLVEIDQPKSVKISLLILAVIMILFSLASVITSSGTGALIPVLQTIAATLGILVGVLLLVGILMVDQKTLVAAYFSCLVLFILMAITVILNVINAILGNRKEEGESGWSVGNVVFVILTLLVVGAAPFAIAFHLKHTFNGYKVSVTPKEFSTCVPCRAIKIKVEDTNTVKTDATSAV